MIRYFKHALAVALSAATLFGTATAQQPLQWRYSFDIDGDAVATYPGDVAIAGTIKGATYEGVLNTRFDLPSQINPALLSIMATRADYVRDEVESLRLVLPNFLTTPSGETAATATRTYNASIEYPIGTVTQFTFAGNATGTVAPGTPWLYSDPVSIRIPAHSLIKLQIRQASAEGILLGLSTSAYGPIGDQQTFGANVANETMNPAWVGTPGGNSISGILIGKTSKRSLMILGDSREQGTGLTANTVAYWGQSMPSLAPVMAVLNFGRGSMKAVDLSTPANFAARKQMFQYVTDVELELGTNDLSGTSVTAAQLTGYRTAARNLAPDKRWWQTTIWSQTTSTDAWATLTNQTPNSNAAAYVAFNGLVRAGQNGYAGYIELADPFQSARDSGILKAPPMIPSAITTDGNHVNNAGYALGNLYVPVVRIAAPN